MAWELRGNPKTVRITKKIAAEWAAMDPVGVDRPLSETRMAVYRKMLNEGAFRPVAWAKVWIKELEGWYRVNGKHTSTLFSLADPPKDFEPFAVIEEYDAETVNDAVALYATFDSKTQTRNANDINKQFASIIPEMKDWDTPRISLMVGSLSFNPAISGSGSTGKETLAERAEKLFDNVPMCLWASDVLGGRNTHVATAGFNFIWRVPVVAAMFATYKRSQKAATEFWRAVKEETGTTPTLPDRKLAKWLSSMRLGGPSDQSPRRFKVLPREFYVRSITAWNAWRAGEKTELKYFANAKLPAPK